MCCIIENSKRIELKFCHQKTPLKNVLDDGCDNRQRGGVLSQCVCVCNHNVHFKYIRILFLNYTLLNLTKTQVFKEIT